MTIVGKGVDTLWQNVKFLLESVRNYMREIGVIINGIKGVHCFKYCINDKTHYGNIKGSIYEERSLIQI